MTPAHHRQGIGLRTITATRLPNLPLSPEPMSNAAAEALAVRS